MKYFLLNILVVCGFALSAQTTLIPDANFEQVLINLGYDTGSPDGSVPTANIDTINILNIYNSGISSLTGIEDFIALKELRCSNNLLTRLNMTQNTALTILWCGGNQIDSLNVAQNVLLTELLCSSNQLTNLDISQNLNLIDLKCGANFLTSLDVTQNIALVYLFCGANFLTSLDVNQNVNLNTVSCANMQLTELDFSQNSSLINLVCHLNLNLTSVDMRNGNNVNITNFSSIISANLKCIYVDDKTASYLSSWNKDTTSHWVNDSLDCQNIVSINKYDIVNPVNLYPNPATEYAIFQFEKAPVRLTIYDIKNRVVFNENIEELTFTLNTRGFEKGIYFCTSLYKGTVFRKKLIIT